VGVYSGNIIYTHFFDALWVRNRAWQEKVGVEEGKLLYTPSLKENEGVYVNALFHTR